MSDGSTLHGFLLFLSLDGGGYEVRKGATVVVVVVDI